MVQRGEIYKEMSVECEFCNGTFKSRQSMLYHQKNTKFCRDYRDIRFNCTRCTYTTLSINDIDKHLTTCTCSNKEITDTIADTDDTIADNTATSIKIYETRLAIEKAKNEIWMTIIEKNLNIKLPDIISDENNKVQFYPIDGIDIDIIVHKYLYKPPTEVIEGLVEDVTPIDSDITKKKNYRSLKGSLTDIDIPNPTEPKTPTPTPPIIFIEDLQTSIEYFNDIFEKLKHTRNYTKLLEDFRDKRSRIFSSMILEDYISLIQDHITRLKDIFITKNYTEKKIQTIISKSLTSLEARLVSSNSHIETHLDVNELNIFLSVIKKKSDHSRIYTPYIEESMYTRFYNYGIVVFSLNKMIDNLLFNIHGYNNIIYLPLQKSSVTDPYSFYILEKVNGDKKFWRMDCRLEELLTSLVSNLLPYMVGMFRILYKRVFGDNDFRMDYSTRCQLTDGDCTQLLQNIILISKTNVFHKILKQKVCNMSTYKPTDNDKFNLQGDDALQRKRLQDKEEPDAVDVLKQIFDSISTEEMVDFYRTI